MAQAQGHLGAALVELAGAKSDLTYIDLGLKHMDLALEVNTRNEVPLTWAVSQLNRAVPLMVLAHARNDLVGLNKAREAIESALTEFSERKTPFYWVSAQTDFAIVEMVIAMRTNDRILINRGEARAKDARLIAIRHGYGAVIISLNSVIEKISKAKKLLN